MNTMAQISDAQNSNDREEIKAAVSRMLVQESLRNERKLAYIKVCVLFISSAIDTLIFFFPEALMDQEKMPPTVALISNATFFMYLTFLIILRRRAAWRWSTVIQTVIPLFDGMVLTLFIANIWLVLGDVQPSITTNIAAFCCLLAASGGIRIKRGASVLTTALALGNFTFAAVLFQLNFVIALFSAVTILGTGLLGMMASGIVRRQSKNEAGRLLMKQFLPHTIVETAFERPIRLLELHKEELNAKLKERQETIENIFDLIHSGPLQDLAGIIRYSLESKSEDKVLLRMLNQLYSDIREINETIAGSIIKDSDSFYLKGTEKVDLSLPFEELMYEVYRKTLERKLTHLNNIHIRLPFFDPIEEKNLSLSAKKAACCFLEEALCNVGKHAVGATRLEVIGELKDNHYSLIIIDDGLGGDFRRKGEGTKQTQKIASKLDGEFRRSQRERGGTICELKWPLNSSNL